MEADELFERHQRAVVDFAALLSERVQPLLPVPSALADDRIAALVGYFMRAVAWMKSVARLDHPVTFQAQLSATRSLLEIATDMLLVHADQTLATAEIIRDWEFSSKLHSAEKIEHYYHSRHEMLPDYHAAIRDFLIDQRAAIVALRAKRWPTKNGKGTHPNRWDKRTLGEAVAAAEAGCRGCLGNSRTSLVRIHDEHYPRLCLAVHGSGLTLVRGIKAETITGYSVLGHRDTLRLAGCCANVALHDRRPTGFDVLQSDISKFLAALGITRDNP